MFRGVALFVVALAMACCCLSSLPLVLFVDASSAAGSETLVGIVGRDFVLLGADSSASQSIALTACNLDKIAHLVDPFPDANKKKIGNPAEQQQQQLEKDVPRNGQQRKRHHQQQHQQQTILAAAAGDAADSDRLLGYLKAIGSIEEYKKSGKSCDVVLVSLGGNSGTGERAAPGLDARSMAHLARRCIWEKLRSRTPYRVCLLVAGMLETESSSSTTSETEESFETEENDGKRAAFLSERVQNQVQRALENSKNAKHEERPPTRESAKQESPSSNEHGQYKPSLFWLDEYGSLQDIEYGAHGHGSNFLLSILDQHYRPDLTRVEALSLMKECFRELRGRYVINSPEDPCIKCVDADGVRLM